MNRERVDAVDPAHAFPTEEKHCSAVAILDASAIWHNSHEQHHESLLSHRTSVNDQFRSDGRAVQASYLAIFIDQPRIKSSCPSSTSLLLFLDCFSSNRSNFIAESDENDRLPRCIGGIVIDKSHRCCRSRWCGESTSRRSTLRCCSCRWNIRCNWINTDENRSMIKSFTYHVAHLLLTLPSDCFSKLIDFNNDRLTSMVSHF